MRLQKVAAMSSEQIRHEKSWGYEIWIANRDYCGKILHFNKGMNCSMHFHLNKHETFFLRSGQLNIDLMDTEKGEMYSILLVPGDSLVIPPGQPHLIHAIEESELFEFSTHHEDQDSYRLWR